MEKSRFTMNRTLCAICGPVGKGAASFIDTICKAAGLSPDSTERARLVVSQGIAFMASAAGAPEAAASILSSTGSMPYNPMDVDAMIEKAKAAEKANTAPVAEEIIQS